jgi:lysozyme
MHMSQRGMKLLAQWEGIRKAVYDDVAGLPTIGVGHLLTQDELHSGTIDIDGRAVDYRSGLSDSQVLDLLAQDLIRFEKAVEAVVQVPLLQNQFDALIAFTFNVGTSAFEKSTLLKVLNQGQYDQVPAQLRRWVKAGGKTVDGLVNRRENEIALWNDQTG